MAKRSKQREVKTASEDEFKREVLDHRELPVLVQFFGDWCGPCRRMHAVLDELVGLQPGKFKLVKIDTGKQGNYSLLSQYGEGNAIPQFVVFRQGKRVGSLTGYQMRGPFWRWLEPLLK
jgi:thioredoxin 1